MSLRGRTPVRRTLALLGIACAVVGASCALPFSDYGLEEGTTATSGSTGASTGSGSTGAGGGPAFVATTCPPGTFATSVTAEGKLTCGTIDAATVDAVNAGCTVYNGWNAGCSGCADEPSTWGKVGATSCTPGSGSSATCPTRVLDGATVNLFGYASLDINPGESDKFYYGFTCAEGITTTAPGPCGAGEVVQGYDGFTTTCVPASGAVMGYVRDRCSLYVGWSDDCYQACELTPERWGKVGTNDCDPGTGAPNTCTKLTDGGVDVNLVALGTYGFVDYNDEFYTGLACTPPPPVTSDAIGTCPPDQLVVGIDADGTLHCANPAPEIARAFADRCTLYSGWDQDLMAADPTPERWGRVRVDNCNPDLGAGSKCRGYVMGGVDVETFSLKSASGGQFFTGFACASPPLPEMH